MIAITRTQPGPSSLDTEEIKTYVQACADYKTDPDNSTKPEKPGSYRSSDLLEAFDRCFFSKCYLTEQKSVNSWSMDVEHFIPQNENPSLVYEWNNLYPANHDANMSKPRSTPEGGYLDPCNPDDHVEEELFYGLGACGENPEFGVRDTNNTKAINTAELLTRLHNGHSVDSKKKTESLRYAIRLKYDEINHAIMAWLATQENTQERFQKECLLKRLLSRRSSFTMLCRSMPAVRKYLDDSFFD